MSRHRRDKRTSKHAPDEAAAPEIRISENDHQEKAVKRSFPGPSGAAGRAPLRLAMEREAMANLSAHARESLDCEVCGVLAGELCKDDEGAFVHVKAAVRGQSVRQGNVHVTYTQETWAGIHEEMEKDYPKLRIVGWYHSHPGFGVQFSDMDIFIHQNFFGARHQVAVVIDPISGQLGMSINRDGGIVYLPQCWVDGREMSGWVPPRDDREEADAGSPSSASSGATEQQLSSLDQRLNQVMQALDETRNDFYRTLLFAFCMVAIVMIGLVGWQFWKWFTYTGAPPEPLGTYSELVRVGDKDVRLSIAVAQWDVPPSISSRVIEADRIEQKVREEYSKQLEAHLLEVSRRLQEDDVDPVQYGLPLPPPEPQEAATDETDDASPPASPDAKGHPTP